MTFVLPFEKEIHELEQRLVGRPKNDRTATRLRQRINELEKNLYPDLNPYETFLLSGHPLRPKTLDYVNHIFHDVRLEENPSIQGDHLLIAGEGKIDIDDKSTDIIIIGQQTGPSSTRDDLLKLPVSEYKRWNQGMGFPDSYRKAVALMNRAEKKGWPVIVFVDTPGADPSEYAEEQGQAFAINEVIHKTTSLRTPNLAYIISLGASGGAIAITPTNRTIMNQYATYMVISPGGCASILFRNRSPESIRNAAVGLRLTSEDALQQGTVDEIVPEGTHPGHRYPTELLDNAKTTITNNLREILKLNGAEAETARREKFFAMGHWGISDETRHPDTLAKQATQNRLTYDKLICSLSQHLEYILDESTNNSGTGNSGTGVSPVKHGESTNPNGRDDRLSIARLLYAVHKHDTAQLERILNHPIEPMSKVQWLEVTDFIMSRRYKAGEGHLSLDPNNGQQPYRRLHPVDWIRLLTDENTFIEFEETIRYRSIDQLHFPHYEQALERGIKSTNLQSGLITGKTHIADHPAVLAINNFGLVGSSLCDEISEKFRHAAHHALSERIPMISVAMGGGARMQEGTPSMHRNIPKAQHALNELEEAGIPHISIIADPTLGGTAISYGLRGDLMIVVKGSANIGFSGKRVVEQFQQRKVAKDFQHENWLMHRGFVDECVSTENMRTRLTQLLELINQGTNLTDIRTRQLRTWEPQHERSSTGL